MPRNNFTIFLLLLLLCLFCAKRAAYRDWVLIDALHKIRAKSLYAPAEEALFEGAMHGLTGALAEEGDRWSEYVPHREESGFHDQINNRIEGIGVHFQWDKKKKEYVIFYPLFDSPAFRAGIRPGDAILAVDGTKIGELPFDKISGMIRGKPGSTVCLEVRHRGTEQTEEIDIRRASVGPRNVLGDTLQSDGTPSFLLQTEPKVAYFNMNSGFTESTTDEVRDALKTLPDDVSGLILDLRGNPGGYVHVCVDVANMFVKPTARYTDIVSTKRRDGTVKDRHAATAETLFEKPMVVLIDGNSASASEILAACLQDFGRATVVGTRSYGKGTVQEIFDLPFESGMLKLTDASYWRPSGKNINRLKNAPLDEEWGVSPDAGSDIPVSRSQAYAAARLRAFRANVPGADASAAAKEITEFVRELNTRELLEGDEIDESTDIADGEREESGNGKEETVRPFALEGNAPYYDLQLARAIEVLKKMHAKSNE